MNLDRTKIRGFIFDLDGTLADTMPLHLQAWNEIGKQYNLSLSHEEHLRYAGMPTQKIVEMQAEKQGLKVDSGEFMKQKESFFVKELLPKVTPMATVFPFLKDLHGQYPSAIGTGSNFKTASKVVDYLQVEEYIKGLVTADDVENHKPFPDTFLACAEKIGIAPEHCLVFEDAGLGMQAAKNAGMQAINITEETDADMLELFEYLQRNCVD